MAIIVDKETRLVVQGLTGREGRFHALRNRAYGTNLVAGVTPGKEGQDVEGVPVFNTVAGAVAGTDANTSLIFVPARFAVDALYEAVDAGIETVVLITENIPVLDMTRAYNYVRAKGVTLIGPNCPGVISPGKANVGIIPGEITHEGPVGLVSRSGTLTYQVMAEMAAAGVGQTTCVGIGGDPVVGSNFIDVLTKFQADGETEAVVMIGEIGGDEEEQAARFVAEHMSKPVVAYIAGFEAPVGKRMGHAGAIISGSSGTAQAKAEALESAGVRVGRSPTEAAERAVRVIKGCAGGTRKGRRHRRRPFVLLGSGASRAADQAEEPEPDEAEQEQDHDRDRDPGQDGRGRDHARAAEPPARLLDLALGAAGQDEAHDPGRVAEQHQRGDGDDEGGDRRRLVLLRLAVPAAVLRLPVRLGHTAAVVGLPVAGLLAVLLLVVRLLPVLGLLAVGRRRAVGGRLVAVGRRLCPERGTVAATAAVGGRLVPARLVLA
jgi:succinyl-CoA synthetase alpha subunit